MYRVAFGAYVLRDGIDRSTEMGNFVTATLRSASVDVSSLDLFQTREQLTEAVKSGDYNLLITYETLKDISIGAGAVKEWRALNPECRVIMIVKSQRKGGPKLKSLYELEYLDALFDNEFNGIQVARLLASPRSKESAFEYYGIKEEVPAIEVVASAVQTTENSVKVKAVPVSESGEEKSDVAEEKKTEEKVEEKKDESAPAAAGSDDGKEVKEELDGDEDDLLAMLDGAFDDTTASAASVEVEKDKEESGGVAMDFFGGMSKSFEEERKEGVPASGNGFSFFGGGTVPVVDAAEVRVVKEYERTVEGKAVEEKEDKKEEVEESKGMAFDFFGTTVESRGAVSAPKIVIETIETGVKSDREKSGDFTTDRNKEESAYIESSRSTGIVVRNTRGTDMSGKISGYVLEVMDTHVLTVETKENYYMDWDPSTMSFTIMIPTGQAGKVVNGVYRASTVVIKGYGVCFIEDNVLMLEVPDKDLTLIEGDIRDKNCTLVMKSLA